MALKHPITFASAPFERSAHRRNDYAWLEAAKVSSESRFLIMHKGKILCTDNGIALNDVIPGGPTSSEPRDIAWLTALQLPDTSHCQFIFLGEEKQTPRFGVNLPYAFEFENSPISQYVFGDIRAIASAVSSEDAQYASTTASILNWLWKHSYCANCGTKTNIADAGWKRVCPSCETEHFPRIEPVAIMLAVKGEKCLMGRQSHWAPHMYSCLAGFVEPGETFEQAGARELFEEAGVVATGRTEYLFGQPWPFPSSLMIGMIIEVESEMLNVDTSEIETARWFTRQEAQQILDGTHTDVNAPSKIAIAYHVLKAWLESDKW